MKKVAALFVEATGCYNLDFVDLWDEKRDARIYTGSLPVVAHPPCQRWSVLAELVYSKNPIPEKEIGNDGGCFASALANVERCGGVLEHPARSKAFRAHGLDKPKKSNSWVRSREGWVCEVWQNAYGHKAAKGTWLYYVGRNKPFELRWERCESAYNSTGTTIGSRSNWIGKPGLSAKERIATPPAFRNVLFSLAEFSQLAYGNPMADHFYW